jgi:hypothetical protein
MSRENERHRRLRKMTYYCDVARHLVCFPYSIEGLHLMAGDLHIGRGWFHKNHYDIPKKRVAEITAKCVVVSSKDIVRIIRGKFEPPSGGKL